MATHIKHQMIYALFCNSLSQQHFAYSECRLFHSRFSENWMNGLEGFFLFFFNGRKTIMVEMGRARSMRFSTLARTSTKTNFLFIPYGSRDMSQNIRCFITAPSIDVHWCNWCLRWDRHSSLVLQRDLL